MNKVDDILIVGGGSSGWICASFLIKTFPNKKITVLESPDVPIVGVGESTLADITNFREYLGIDEKDFMKYTNASYKMSIKFTDFYDKDYGSFHYPFRYADTSDTINGLADWMEMKAYYPDIPNEDFIRSYFPHSYLFENNKFSDNKYGFYGNFNKKTDVAYHFDSVLFGRWLKEKYCIPRGVNYISDEVVDATLDNSGIKTLTLKSKKKISADLYIDCTGFKSLLLSEFLKEPFDSYSSMLPNNRAWATQLPYKNIKKELEPFTNSTAIDNGWCWNIPLWSRLGTGYVYSDNYVSKEDALKEFKEYLKSDKMVMPRTDQDLENLEFKDISMRVGIHKRTWVKNVVGIGLSAGFIEPLESNGLFTVCWFVEKLAKSLLRGHVSQWDRDVYNVATRNIYNNFAEFVALHYALSARTDTKYWQDISERQFDPDFADMKPTSNIGFWDLQNKKMFDKPIDSNAGITYVGVGMNYPMIDRVDLNIESIDGDKKIYIDRIKQNFDNKKKRWSMYSSKELSLYEWLKENIYFSE
ncbi:tryptophan 7-halogenase [Planktomarina sp.]|jgi:hypothetical protein|nr:tryptophan 7-halogenase [Planktomarina sp.]